MFIKKKCDEKVDGKFMLIDKLHNVQGKKMKKVFQFVSMRYNK